MYLQCREPEIKRNAFFEQLREMTTRKSQSEEEISSFDGREQKADQRDSRKKKRERKKREKNIKISRYGKYD